MVMAWLPSPTTICFIFHFSSSYVYVFFPPFPLLSFSSFTSFFGYYVMVSQLFCTWPLCHHHHFLHSSYFLLMFNQPLSMKIDFLGRKSLVLHCQPMNPIISSTLGDVEGRFY
jgi:hypothetical protein